MANVPNSVWFVYLLECTNGKLYTGITPDLAERFKKHSTGKGAMFTRINRPERMIAAKPCENRSEASKLERQGAYPGAKALHGSRMAFAGWFTSALTQTPPFQAAIRVAE